MSSKGDFLSGFSTTAQPKTPATVPASTEAAEKKDLKNAPQNVVPAKDKLPENKQTAKAATAAPNAAKAGATPAKAMPNAPKNAAASQAGKAATGKKDEVLIGTTATKQSASAIIKAPEHTVTKDTTFHHKKMIRTAIICATVFFVLLGGYFAIQSARAFTVPDFVGDDFKERNTEAVAQPWNFSSTEVFSLEFDEGKIISQDVEAGKRAKHGTNINVTVSKGPDMDEVIKLPDFKDMTRAQINTWVKDNKMGKAISFREEASATVEANKVIEIDVPSTTDMDRFTRQSNLTIVVSKGAPTVKVDDFRKEGANTREHVEKWMQKHPEIEVEFIYEYKEKTVRDIVLGQSIQPDKEIPVGKKLTITLAQGEPIKLPNFASLSYEDAQKALVELKLEKAKISERYNESVPYGELIHATHGSEAQILDPKEEVNVIYSAGSPWIERLSKENDIAQWIRKQNSMGATFTYAINRIDSYEERGTIVEQSLHNQYVGLSAHIVYTISRGNLDKPVETKPDPPFQPQPQPPASTQNQNNQSNQGNNQGHNQDNNQDNGHQNDQNDQDNQNNQNNDWNNWDGNGEDNNGTEGND